MTTTPATCYPAVVVEPSTRFVVVTFGDNPAFDTFDAAVAAARATITDVPGGGRTRARVDLRQDVEHEGSGAEVVLVRWEIFDGHIQRQRSTVL